MSIIAPDNVISKAQCAPHRPEGTPHKTPAGYFCTRGERRVHKIRICRSIALFNDRERCISNIAYSIACEALNVIARSCLQRRGNLPEGTPQYKTHARYFCTCVEEKEHTSKRVSIIACNNVISKVQCATCCPNQTLK